MESTENLQPVRTADGTNVGDTVISAIAKIRHLESEGGILGAHGFIKTTPQREWRISRNGIVHRHTCKIYILSLRIITAVLEPDVAESVTHHVGIYVVGTEQNGRGIRVSAVVEVEFRKIGSIHLFCTADRRESNEHKVPYYSILHSHVELRGQELVRIYRYGITAVRKIFEEETSVRCRLYSLYYFIIEAQAYCSTLHRNSSGAVDNLGLDTSVVSGSGDCKSCKGADYCQCSFHYFPITMYVG